MTIQNGEQIVFLCHACDQAIISRLIQQFKGISLVPVAAAVIICSSANSTTSLVHQLGGKKKQKRKHGNRKGKQ